MFCTSCGTQIDEGRAHCTNCGAKVGGAGVAAAMLSQSASNAFSSMDRTLRNSILFGAGSIAASILALMAGFFVFFFAPLATGLGVAALVFGGRAENKTGYYLGVIGTTAGAITTYLGIVVYAAYSGILELRNSMGSLF